MKIKRANWFKDFVNNKKNDPEFLAESLVIEINEEICRLMEEHGLSRSELARRLGVSRQLVSGILNGRPNLTLLTLTKICTALDVKPRVTFEPLVQEKTKGTTLGFSPPQTTSEWKIADKSEIIPQLEESSAIPNAA